MTDFFIVGGGVIGLLTARELHKAGASVTVIDRHETGCESSWAGGGILSPLYPWRYPEPVTQLANWSQLRYPSLAQELLEETGINSEWTQNGLLILDTEEQAQAIQWANRISAIIEVLDTKEIKNHEPGLGPKVNSALWFPEIAQIRNPHLVRALKSSLITAGVIFKENTEITDLVISNGRVTGLNSSDGQLSCNKVILASGAWSDQLLEGLNSRIDVRPIRGQMILFKTKPKTVLRIVLSRDRYVIPRRDGRVLVGSTLEDVGFNKDTTEEAKLALLEAGTRLIPQLAEYPIERHWAGLRPGSTTGIPYIGPFPSIQGIYVNTGHFRNGVVLAPASARLMADISLGNTPILDPAPYAVQNISKP